MIHAGAGLLTVLLFSVTGWALTELVPALRRRPPVPRWGYAYLLGLAWTGGALYGLSHGLGIPLRRPAILAVAAIPVLVAILLGVLRRGRPRDRAAGPGPLVPKRSPAARLLWLAVWVCAAAPSVAVLADAVASPATDWDGRMTWGMQARWLWAAGTVDAPVLQNSRWYVSHPQYPLLMPIAQVVAMEIYGAADDDRVCRPIYAVVFAALLAILYDQARRWLGRRAAALTLLIAATVPLLAFDVEAGALSGYSDLPLAGFYGAGLVLLLARPRLSEGLAAGLLLGAAVLTKNEGTPLALAALALGAGSAVLRLRRRARPRLAMPVLAAALLVASALALVHSWRSQVPNREDERYLSRLGVSRLAADFLPHARIAAPLALNRMLSRAHWGFFWPVAAVILLTGLRGLRRPPSLRLALAFACPLMVGFLAYATHWDPAYLVGVTWNRMILHGALPLFLLVGTCLRPLLIDAREAFSRAGRTNSRSRLPVVARPRSRGNPG